MKSRAFGWALIVLGFALLAGYVAVDVCGADLAAQGTYGVDASDGRNWSQKLSPGRVRLFVGLIAFAVPSMILLYLGTGAAGLRERIAELARRCVLAPRPAAFAIALCAAVFVSTQLISSFALDHVPISDDEDMYLFQARVLADGHLTAPSHPLREFFDNIFLVNDGRMYGQYPFGHSLVLAFGVLTGRPSVVVSLLAALSAALLYLLARRVFDESTGRVSAILLAASPWFLATSSTLLSQTTVLALVLGCALSAAAAADSGRKRWIALAALLAGACIHVRPGDAALWCAPLVLYLLWRRWREGDLPRAVAWTAAGVVVPVVLVFVLNWLVNGDPLVPNYVAAWRTPRPHFPSLEKEGAMMLARTLPLGFGTWLWQIQHTPLQGLANTWNNAFRANLWLFGVPFSLLVFAAGLVLRQIRGIVWPMVLSIPAAIVFYFFFFWPGIAETGPVHYYPALPVLVIVSAAALVHWSRRSARNGSGPRGPAVVTGCAVCLLVAAATFHQVQWRALQRVAAGIEEPYRMIEASVEKPALVFFRYYVKPQNPKGWHAGRRNNAPDFEGDVLYVLDLGLEEDRRLTAYYPERRAYRFKYEQGVPRLFAFGPSPHAPRIEIGEDGRVRRVNGD